MTAATSTDVYWIAFVGWAQRTTVRTTKKCSLVYSFVFNSENRNCPLLDRSGRQSPSPAPQNELVIFSRGHSLWRSVKWPKQFTRTVARSLVSLQGDENELTTRLHSAGPSDRRVVCSLCFFPIASSWLSFRHSWGWGSFPLPSIPLAVAFGPTALRQCRVREGDGRVRVAWVAVLPAPRQHRRWLGQTTASRRRRRRRWHGVGDVDRSLSLLFVSSLLIEFRKGQ